jgi:hypothetical protein
MKEIHENFEEQLDKIEDDVESEMKYLPKSDGAWEGDKGYSKWIPNDDKIPGKANSEYKSWADIKEEYDIDGIEFVNGEPDFTELARGEARIEDFTGNRYKNFTQADEYEAERRGCSPEDVEKWREENGYTWHERKDCETMDKVPSIVHNNVFHSGGISEKKKELNMEDWL